MKLNYKRTVLVGFAFFLICAFWQAYDNTIPLTLTNKFGMSQGWSGVIMALDNILALVLLPLFGGISDRHQGKYGRRTPFIAVGTVLAAVAFVALSFVDNMQLQNLKAVSQVDDPASLQQIYESQRTNTLKTPEGEEFVLEDRYTLEQFMAIRSDAADKTSGQKGVEYTNYVVPARQAYAWQTTVEHPAVLTFFVGLLLVVLVSMAIFRSPAVALMPDVTVKPLRSKANAVINLMGTAGGMLVLGLGMVFATSAVKNAMMSYRVFYLVVSLLMLGALTAFLLTVREKQWALQMQQDSVRYGLEEAEKQTVGKKLSSAEKRSLAFLLISIVMWYFGYNAVTSKYSVYASNILNKDYNTTLLLAQVAAIISYLPVGMIASRVGRKKTILAGVLMLGVSFGAASFMRADSSTMLMNVLFALAGIGWATINVNSFPMAVEMCSGADVGKYTGYYYAASMAAQVATPVLSGFLMDSFGMTVLFPYAAVFVAIAFVTMLFVMHGDNKVEAKKGLEAFDIED